MGKSLNTLIKNVHVHAGEQIDEDGLDDAVRCTSFLIGKYSKSTINDIHES